jgi:hypothetical protein
MTIANDLLQSCKDSFGFDLPLSEDIRNCGGICIDSSKFGNCDTAIPFDVYRFPDKSELIISGSYLKKVSTRLGGI